MLVDCSCSLMVDMELGEEDNAVVVEEGGRESGVDEDEDEDEDEAGIDGWIFIDLRIFSYSSTALLIA